MKTPTKFIRELTAEQQKRFRDAVKPVYERSAASIGKDTIDRMQAELARIRG